MARENKPPTPPGGKDNPPANSGSEKDSYGVATDSPDSTTRGNKPPGGYMPPDDLIEFLGTSRLEIPLGTLAGTRRRQKDILVLPEPRPEPTGIVSQARQETQEKFGGTESVSQVRELLEGSGNTEHVAKVTAKLESAGLDRTERLLLSVPGVYATLIGQALELSKANKFDLTDTSGLLQFVRRRLSDKSPESPRNYFTGKLLEKVLDKQAPIQDSLRALILDELRQQDLPSQGDRAEKTIEDVVDQFRERGNLAAAVRMYALRKEIEPARFTQLVQQRMVDHLKKLGIIDFTPAKINSGEYDEYLALAYQQAITGGNGSSADPIDAVRHKGAVVDWNFAVDTFDTVEEQGIIPQNILAAGALDYIYELGERLGVFRLADAVVLRWGSGSIDLDPGETPAKLYRYWKLRSERTSPEERAMLYTRVLNKGNGEMLEGMVANEAFPELWGTLMTVVTEYIQRVEEKKSEDQSVSKQKIYQATRQLQYNLTEFTTGMAQMQISEMYHHLQEARGILEDPQVMDYFGSGRRKTIWTVIERASKEWFDYSPNIAAIRDAAVQGNKVFQWIANFDQTTVNEADFLEFKDAAEAWILASGIDTSQEPEPGGDEDKTEDDSEKITIKDDFDSDWDA